MSSTMLSKIAAQHKVGYAETLTGFKWISRAAPDLVFGYEEALGYAVAPHLVSDKDGISTALLVLELAANLKAHGSTLQDRLDEITTTYGHHTTAQISTRFDDLTARANTMAALRDQPPTTLLNQPTTVTDLQPAADVLTIHFNSGRVVFRPSGTEPKLKTYLEVTTITADQATTTLAALKTELATILETTTPQ